MTAGVASRLLPYREHEISRFARMTAWSEAISAFSLIILHRLVAVHVSTHYHPDLQMELLVKAVIHFLYMERGVVVGQLEVYPAAAVDRGGIAVVEIDGEVAVEVDLALFWFMPPQGRDVQGEGLGRGEQLAVGWQQVG